MISLISDVTKVARKRRYINPFIIKFGYFSGLDLYHDIIEELESNITGLFSSINKSEEKKYDLVKAIVWLDNVNRTEEIPEIYRKVIDPNHYSELRERIAEWVRSNPWVSHIFNRISEFRTESGNRNKIYYSEIPFSKIIRWYSEWESDDKMSRKYDTRTVKWMRGVMIDLSPILSDKQSDIPQFRCKMTSLQNALRFMTLAFIGSSNYKDEDSLMSKIKDLTMSNEDIWSGEVNLIFPVEGSSFVLYMYE